jgi:acetate---CoA ligase (ADP-forming)
VTAIKILSTWGISFVEHRIAQTAAQAAQAATDLGGDLVLKVVSPDILHKTEIGGVLLGLRGESAVREGYQQLVERTRSMMPSARLEGVMVARQLFGGVEAVIGVVRDPVFGPVVMMGLGGVLVELLDDVTFRLAPFGEEEARRMIADLRFVSIFDGARGAPPCDLDALGKLLARVSIFAAAEVDRIGSMELNPVRVLAEGSGVVALDAVIIPDKSVL